MKAKKEQPIQELKFNIGNVCRYSSSGDYSGSSDYDGELCTVRNIRHEVRYDFPYVVSFKNKDLPQDYPVKEGALELVEESTIIKVSDLKKVHDVACDFWKRKIEAMVKPFEDTVTLTEEQIEEMFRASSQSQTEVLEQVFGKRFTNGLFDFGEEYTITTNSQGEPMHIREAFATDGNCHKEIGFSAGFTPVIVINGKEIQLETGRHGAYIKFKNN